MKIILQIYFIFKNHNIETADKHVKSYIMNDIKLPINPIKQLPPQNTCTLKLQFGFNF